MFEKLLVTLDGSELAEIVIPYVTELASRLGSEIALLHVCSPSEVHSCRVNQIYLDQISGSLKDKVAKGGGEKITISSAVVSGSTVEEILNYAETNNVSMIAMSTHGRAGIGRWVLGSVADRLVSTSSLPVLLVRSKVPDRVAAEKWPAKGVLVPLDGSAIGEAALPYVEELVKTLSRPVVLQQVIPPEYKVVADTYGGGIAPTDKGTRSWKADAEAYLNKVAARLTDQGIESRIDLSTGTPADKIIECAKRCDVDLIAMSTHGFSGIARFILGSVAARVLQAAETPLLLVRPREAKDNRTVKK